MKNKIKKITIVSGSGIRSLEVGVDGVKEIKDTSIEYEDSVHFIYKVIGEDNKLLNSIENCPVVVDYINN